MNTSREFFEDLKKNVRASLEAAGYSAVYQSSQKWPASFQASSPNSQGGVTLFFGRVCEHCSESLPYRVISAPGTFGGRVAIPKDGDAATAADCLIREVLPLLTNRLPGAAPHNPGVGIGLLSPQAAGQLSEDLASHGGSH